MGVEEDEGGDAGGGVGEREVTRVHHVPLTTRNDERSKDSRCC